jgi:hypothetical protein
MARERTRTSHGWPDLLARCAVGVSMGLLGGAIAGGVFAAFAQACGWVEWGLFDLLAPLFWGSLVGAAAGFLWFAADFPMPRLLRRRRR